MQCENVTTFIDRHYDLNYHLSTKKLQDLLAYITQYNTEIYRCDLTVNTIVNTVDVIEL